MTGGTRVCLVVASVLAVSVAAAGGAQQPAQPAAVFTAEDMLAVQTFAGGQTRAVPSGGRWIANAADVRRGGRSRISQPCSLITLSRRAAGSLLFGMRRPSK